jgi:hypothetical protein
LGAPPRPPRTERVTEVLPARTWSSVPHAHGCLVWTGQRQRFQRGNHTRNAGHGKLRGWGRWEPAGTRTASPTSAGAGFGSVNTRRAAVRARVPAGAGRLRIAAFGNVAARRRGRQGPPPGAGNSPRPGCVKLPRIFYMNREDSAARQPQSRWPTAASANHAAANRASGKRVLR